MIKKLLLLKDELLVILLLLGLLSGVAFLVKDSIRYLAFDVQSNTEFVICYNIYLQFLTFTSGCLFGIVLISKINKLKEVNNGKEKK